jgi:hypothetical protein
MIKSLLGTALAALAAAMLAPAHISETLGWATKPLLS